MKRIYRFLLQSIQRGLHCLVILSILLISISCEETPFEEYESQLNIFAILDNRENIHKVIIDRTYKMDELSEPYVDDALVILSGPGFVDTLEFSDSSGTYLATSFAVQAAATYEIIAVKEGFDSLIARTTVPGDFEIIFPVDNDTLTLQDTLVFTKSPGAALYCCCFGENSQMISYFWYEPDTLDILILAPISEYLKGLPGGCSEIRIQAYDRNYFEYHSEPQDSVLRAGVTGGVGVIGSSWGQSTNVYVIAE